MTIDERVTAFMKAHDFAPTGTNGFWHAQDVGNISPRQARFIYRLHLESRRDELINVLKNISYRTPITTEFKKVIQMRIAELNKLIAEAK